MGTEPGILHGRQQRLQDVILLLFIHARRPERATEKQLREQPRRRDLRIRPRGTHYVMSDCQGIRECRTHELDWRRGGRLGTETHFALSQWCVAESAEFNRCPIAACAVALWC